MSGLGDGGLGLGDGEGTGGDGAGAGTVTVSVMVGRIGSLVVVMRMVDWVEEPVPALVGVSSVPSPVSEYAGILGSLCFSMTRVGTDRLGAVLCQSGL